MIKKLAIVMVFFLTLTISPKMSFSASLEDEIEKEIQDIRSKGEPVTAKETLPVSIPKEENGAFVFEQAIALYDKFEKAHKEDIEIILYQGKRLEELSSEDKQRASHLLFNDPELIKMFELFEKSLDMKCQFVDKQNVGPDPTRAIFPHLAKSRAACRLIIAKVFLYQEQKEYEKSLDAIYLCSKLNKIFDNEPFLINELVREAIGYYWLNSLQSVTSEFNQDMPIMKELREQIEREQNREIDYFILTTERTFALDTFDGFLKDSDSFNSVSWLISEEDFKRIKDTRLYVLKNKLAYLQIVKKLIGVSKQPYQQRQKKLKEIWQEMASLPEEDKLAEQVLGVCFCQFEMVAKYRVKLGEAKIALALKRYWLKYKVYPDSLSQLLPEYLAQLPLNPFSGGNYQYQRKGDGFVITAEGSDIAWESKK